MDELKLYSYIAVFGSFAMYFAIAIWARAGSTSEFYAAGGGITPIQNGMAIFQLTGNPIPQLGLGSTLADGSGVYLLDKLDMVVTDIGFKEYTTDNMNGKLDMFAYTMSLMIGTAGLPHVIMRFFTVPSAKAARSSAGWALVFIALLYTVAPAVGAMARFNLMNTIEPTPDEYLAYDERPQWFKDWENTGLLEFEDKNGDGKIQYYADPDTNEMVKVDRDIMVLANPAIANLPNWVIALVAAGGLAAALSTAAGLLLAISSSISHDLLKGVLTPDMTPALMMGIFSKRINNKAAIAGMCSGIGVTMFYVFQHKGIMFIPGTSFLGGMPENWFFGITPNAFGVVGAIVNFAVAFIVTQVTGPAPQNIRDLVENMRTPGGAGAISDH